MTAAEQRAYDEALKRIAECGRRRGTALDLSRLRLTRVPARINQLAKLATLDLSNNLLVTLPPELGELAQLTRLDVSHNPLAALPAVITRLGELTVLDLAHTTLQELPPELGGLVQLTRLDLSHNPLAALPRELGQLANLTRLYLANNRLDALPPELGQLANLTRLYLAHNRLGALPPELGQLANLTRLDLSHNLLATLPPELGQLAKLTVLELAHNQLASLPPEIGGLTKLTVLSLVANRLAALPQSLGTLEMLERLFLHDNPALQLAPSILGADPRHPQDPRVAAAKSILGFYFARLTGRTRPLDEVRVMLLGRCGAGKTSLAQALRDLPIRDREVSTPGIALGTCTLEGSGGQAVTARVWDCSGQELCHELHPLFFSPRSLYVVVLAGGGAQAQADAESWLGRIQEFGTDAQGQVPPAVVALNQWNVPGARPEVDRAALRERFPFIRGFVEMDCKAKKGVPALKAALFRELERMPWVREPIPEEWDAVRRALTADAVRQARLTEAEYRAVCVAHGVTDAGQQDYLTEILHHLGVALNFHGDARLREAAVLAPEWITQNLYALLQRAAIRAGVLTQAEVASVLHAEDEPTRTWLMGFLERLGMACALESAAGHVWLVPQSLPAAPPVSLLAFSDAAEATRLRVTYPVLPERLAIRLGARRYDFIEEERAQKLLWRDGLVFTRKGARALIQIDPLARQVALTVIGPAESREQLAGLCQAELREVHADFPGLESSEEILTQGEWVAVTPR